MAFLPALAFGTAATAATATTAAAAATTGLFGAGGAFALGTTLSTVGTAVGALGALGLWTGSFLLFCLGALMTGIYMSAQGFYRFAAADTASEAFRPKAISWVMAGGLFSAVFGPQLVTATADAYVIAFLGTYLAVIALNLGGMGLFALLRIPRPVAAAAGTPAGRTRAELIRTPVIAVAMICATVAYARARRRRRRGNASSARISGLSRLQPARTMRLQRQVR